MNRQQKYPETSTFHFFNANPKNRVTGDCTFRAISTALRQSWEQTVKEMCEMSIETGYACNDKKGIERYLKSKGWIKHSQPRKADNTKYTGKEFCERARDYENYVAIIGGHHIVAIIDGKVWDTWDSTDGCIGNYWTKG
jgi:hypothetical protein